MRILILTPWVPYPLTGACQQDRFCGYQQMRNLGHEMHVIAKYHWFQDVSGAKAAFEKEGIPLTLVPHPRHPLALLLRTLPAVLRNPALLDGAALEYTDPAYQKVVLQAVREFKPDIVWMEYSTHWPVLRLLKLHGIPTIVKSSLNEPQNCMDEHGRSLLSRLKAIPKYPGERIAAQESTMILAITPDEERFYAGLGAKHHGTLPLRGLSRCFAEKRHAQKDVLDVVFLSSNYNMGHNRDAAEFLLQKIVPLVRQKLPGKFRFHLTGKKFPSSYAQYLADDVRSTGFVEDVGAFLQSMDIALCPWISGAGMQQKVFEPLCRGLPLLTTKTGGYPFVHGQELLLCTTPQDYVDGLQVLLDSAERQRMADAAKKKARTFFGEERVQEIVQQALAQVVR